MLSGQDIERGLLPTVLDALGWSPAVAITGPRTTGKSTLARHLVSRFGGSLLDLDEPSVRTLALDDPAAFINGLDEPIVIDEFQRAPELLSAIKAALNRDRRPGRFVLTGSARHDAVPEIADFLTGRVELLTLWPFAEAELSPPGPTIIDELFSGVAVDRRIEARLTRDDAVRLVVRGGYPIAVTSDPAARERWFANLAQLVVERITTDVQPMRRGDVAHTMLRLAAARTAQISNAADIGRDAGLGRDQAGAYMRLLELVYLVIRLPAWSTNVSSQQIKRPKVHLVDSGLAAHLQGATTFQASEPVAAKRFGALFETFVVTEFLKQLGWSTTRATAFHYRTTRGLEVDLVLETADGRVAGVEVKAGSRVRPDDLAGLRDLRDSLGSRFVGGLVVCTSPQGQRVDDRIAVAPFETLWSSTPG